MEPKHASHAVFNRLSIGPITHLRISGTIDETFAPQSIARDLTGHVIVDLGRIERISSFGVRKWIEFAGKMPSGANGLYVVHAPPAIVDQLNMVEGFGGVAQVLSVLAPYSCTKCGEDRVRLVDLHADAPTIAEGKAPPHDCPVCGSQLQFADLPAEFFDYARHQTLPPLDPAVARYLKTLQPVEPNKDEVAAHVKLVHDDMTFFRVSNVLRGDLNVRKLGSGLEGRVIYDFGQVAVAEPEAGPKLQQILEAASQGAQVYLWRVPPEVLALLSATGKPLPGALSTLYLPCDCRNCGSRSRQRIDAQLYVRGLMSGDPGEVQCGICGGQARVPVLREYASFLTSAPLAAMKGDEVEALEPRALSQYLAGVSDTSSGGGKPDTATGNNLGSSLKLQILRRLGQGGMAEVFLARQVGIKGFEKYVVVKKILENLASQPDFVEMLFAEARANARLTHQNIVQTYDVGMMSGVAYITMEYVRGPDVKKLMTLARKAGVQVPIAHLLRIVAETAAGLHYAHSYVDPTGKQHPMVHRDVSPHNILLSLDGAIKLSDFGIAKVQGEADNTRPGTFKGKIAYLSPEAIAGMQLDARSDVFALGVTLFELLTGRLPFRRENEAATLHAIMREPAPNLTKLNPAVPDDLSALVARSLEKDPARRTPSAGEFHRELEAIMNRHNLNASPTAVAMFFQEALGAQLAEFSPTGSAAPATGTGLSLSSAPKPSAPAAEPVMPFNQAEGGTVPPRRSAPPPMPLSPEPRTGSRAKAAAPATPLPPEPRTGSRAGQAQPPPPPVPQASLAEPPPPSGGSRAAPPPRPAQAARPPAPAPAPRAAPPPPPPVPNVAAASLPLGVEKEPPTLVTGPLQAKGRAAEAPAPAPEPKRRDPETLPETPALVAAPAAFDDEEPSRGGGSKLWIAGGATFGAVAVLGMMMLLGRGSGKVEVSNLPADERLYVSGVRVDPSNLRLEGTQPLIISTAFQGRLHRLGRAAPAAGIDVKSLVEVSDPGGSELTAPLSVASDPAGCAVAVDGKRLPESTPTKVALEAGREQLVEVFCPGKPSWSQWVMAAPGQALEISASGSSF